MKRRLLYEIIVIVLIASAIGIAYNAFLQSPIPLIYIEKEKVAVDDSLLFVSDYPDEEDIANTYPKELTEKDSNKIIIEVDTLNLVNNTDIDTYSIQSEDAIKKESPELENANELSVSKTQGKLHGHLEEFTNWVSLDQVKRAINMPNIQFIDTREPEAFEKGKIGNAFHLFPQYDGDEEEGTYFKTILSLDPNMVYILYCNGIDCDLAEMLAEDILSFGNIEEVYIFPGGWDEWIINAEAKTTMIE